MASELDNTRRCGVPVVNTTKPSDSDQEFVFSDDSGAPSSSLPQHTNHSRKHSFPNVKHEKAINNGLDGELSGLQKAATKTALRSSVNRGLVATEKEEDEQYLHWVFHRHVGFTTDESNNSKTYQMQKVSNGHIHKWRHPQSTQALETISSATTADTIESSKLSERQRLLEELLSIRQQREHLRQNVFPSLHRHHDEWDFRYISAQQSYQYALSSLEATRTQRIWAEKEYQLACRWHVLSDTFFIWHKGPFGTISGFRLGRSAVTMIGLVKKCTGSGSSASGQSASATSPSIFSWGTSEHAVSSQEANATTQQSIPHTAISTSSNAHPSHMDPEKVIVPWSEINSALGQIVLLLYTLQNTPFSGISFRKYALQPCGSSSKIGLLKRNANQTTSSPQRPKNERRRITALTAYLDTDKNPGATKPDDKIPIHSKPISSSHKAAPLPHEVTWYNLHHYEENGSMLSLGYYARRNFNTALEALLFCIAETCLVVQNRDMALAAPYTIRVDGLVVGKDAYLEGSISKSDDEATVGGLPFSYDPGEGERWTLACKYLLTNLKWVMAYAVKQSSV
jgi:hypothetical protein